MADAVDKKKKGRNTDIADPRFLQDLGLPSDEDLQKTKQDRQDLIESGVTKLRNAGYPGAAEAAGGAAGAANDIVSPKDREDYVAGMVPMVGSVEKPLFSNAVAKGEAQPGASAFSKFIRGEGGEAAEAAGAGGSGAPQAPLKSPLSSEAQGAGGQTWSKPGSNTPSIKDLQQQMGDLMDQGKYQEARELQMKIRNYRENPRWTPGEGQK